jgi:hypothetical protein
MNIERFKPEDAVQEMNKMRGAEKTPEQVFTNMQHDIREVSIFEISNAYQQAVDALDTAIGTIQHYIKGTQDLIAIEYSLEELREEHGTIDEETSAKAESTIHKIKSFLKHIEESSTVPVSDMLNAQEALAALEKKRKALEDVLSIASRSPGFN